MKFHMRRVDREIKDQKALQQLLLNTGYLTLSMADGDEPYAVPLDYVYDEEENAVYFHCAREGKKIEFLKKNPRVWGLVVLNQGFGEGQCVNLYASAMFSGRVEFIADSAAKLRVLNLFAEKASRDTAGVKQRLQQAAEGDKRVFDSMLLARVGVEELTGKRSTEMTVEKLLEATAQKP